MGVCRRRRGERIMQLTSRRHISCSKVTLQCICAYTTYAIAFLRETISTIVLISTCSWQSIKQHLHQPFTASSSFLSQNDRIHSSAAFDVPPRSAVSLRWFYWQCRGNARICSRESEEGRKRKQGSKGISVMFIAMHI